MTDGELITILARIHNRLDTIEETLETQRKALSGIEFTLFVIFFGLLYVALK